jgi:hypothetical protein
VPEQIGIIVVYEGLAQGSPSVTPLGLRKIA